MVAENRSGRYKTVIETLPQFLPFIGIEIKVLKLQHSEALATKILVENPARAFAADWRADRACLPR